MNAEYLWNGAGEPDPEVARLEGLLFGLRHRRPLVLPDMPARPRVLRARAWGPLLAAAVVVLALVSLLIPAAPPGPSWDVARVAGSPRLDSRPMGLTGRLRVGQWLETDASSRARIQVGSIGRVDVGPQSRVRLLSAAPSEHRLGLAQGVLYAEVSAPPRFFLVETPSAVAVDLGCAYTLEVDEHGSGRLHVSRGFVALEKDGRETLVPAGALSALRPGRGPGLPYFEDAPADVVGGVARLEDGDTTALDGVLAGARPRDTLTLWHLLSRVAPSERGRVYETMAALRPPPEGVTRDGILALQPAMLLSWRTRLETDWTRPGEIPFRLQKKVRSG
jgi:FecR protein